MEITLFGKMQSLARLVPLLLSVFNRFYRLFYTNTECMTKNIT